MNNWQILKFIIALFVGWKVALLFVTFYGLSVLPHVVQPGGHYKFPSTQTEYWIRWANWDGGHYRGIAENGYLHKFQVVFFPLYPILIKSLMILRINSLWSSLIISHLSLIIALYYLFKLVQLDFGDSIAKKTILLVLVFPTSFYLGTAYSESLFLSLTVAAFYYARKQKWLIASALAGFSATTRLVGIATIAAVFFEYFLRSIPNLKLKYFWQSRIFRTFCYLILLKITFIILNLLFKGQWLILGIIDTLSVYLNLLIIFLGLATIFYIIFKHFSFNRLFTWPSLWQALSLIPLLLYMYYLQLTQQNYLAFVAHETSWGRKIGFPWDTPLGYYQALVQRGFFAGYPGQTLLEFLFFILFFAVLLYSMFKLRVSYVLYYAITLIVPLFSGTLIAIHRYVLVSFPVMIIIALIKKEGLYQSWIIFSTLLLGILAVMFINGYWVT